MNDQQITSPLNLSPSIHRYQVLDAQSALEETRKSLAKDPAIAFSEEIVPSKVNQWLPSRHYLAPSGNPYSNAGNSSIAETISGSHFIEKATRIFKQYSPTVSKRRKLRSEFSKFIKIQSTKAGHIRLRILEQLENYDLEAKGLSCPRFNRELSNSVLKKINALGNDNSSGE